VFNALHLVDLVMIGLVLCLPKFMVCCGFSPGFIFSYISTGQDIGWKERLRYDLYCVEWDVKPQLNQSINAQLSVHTVFTAICRPDEPSVGWIFALIYLQKTYPGLVPGPSVP